MNEISQNAESICSIFDFDEIPYLTVFIRRTKKRRSQISYKVEIDKPFFWSKFSPLNIFVTVNFCNHMTLKELSQIKVIFLWFIIFKQIFVSSQANYLISRIFHTARPFVWFDGCFKSGQRCIQAIALPFFSEAVFVFVLYYRFGTFIWWTFKLVSYWSNVIYTYSLLLLGDDSDQQFIRPEMMAENSLCKGVQTLWSFG